MKRFLLVAVMILALFASSIALAADIVIVKTDKTMYLMDPYYWVYSAAYCILPGPGNVNGEYWPIGGYPRDVNFTVKTYDAIGMVKDLGSLSYKVLDGDSVLKIGPVAATVDPGVYSDNFQLMDADLGGNGFTGQTPKQLILQILDSQNNMIKEQKVYVGRWGCDRCHIESGLAKSIYSWAAPTGGFYGPHGWGGILGRTGSAANAFTDQTLKNSTLAHTPGDILSNHEMTIHKQCGNIACSPCHQGTNGVALRPPWGSGYRDCWVDQSKSRAVECTFCHGIEGGYTPRDAEGNLVRWSSVAGFISPEHGHVNVPAPDPNARPDVIGGPWLARQNCSNPGCHGHINETNEKRVDNAKPDCRMCHGIHNLNPH
ncbi:MAG: hypothetical protein AB1480_12565 [Nitrospirota bacterium]